MLKIRLQRVGRKHEPVFRVVVTDSHAGPKAGKAVEILGSYDPRVNKTDIKADRVKYWMGTGAQVSGTVHNILINKNVIEGKKRNVLPKKTAPVKEFVEAPVVEATPVPTASVEEVQEAVQEIAETPIVETAPDAPESAPSVEPEGDAKEETPTA